MSPEPVLFLPELNGGLQLEAFKGIDQVMWTCHLGHNWSAEKRNVVKKNTGCPFCKNRKVLAGFNDLGTLNPEVAAEWHPTKNVGLPSDILAGSSEVVNWKGTCGHEWEASVRSRTKGAGCHFCGGSVVLAGFNDLATTHPHLAAEWHPTRNDHRATEVLAGSAKRTFWKGVCGHEWEAYVFYRTKGYGCPLCARNARLEEENTVIPEGCLRQWHILNSLRPDGVSMLSAQKVIWASEDGHTWSMSVKRRVSLPLSFCAVCTPGAIRKNGNGRTSPSLESMFPTLAQEWSEKNADAATEVKVNSKDKHIWVCKEGHERETTIASRIKKDGSFTRCQNCYLQENSLANSNPDVASRWDAQANSPVTPQDVSASSAKVFSWKCEKGHKWEAPVYAMTASPATGCPDCTSQTSSGEKNLIDWLGTVYASKIKLRDKRLLGGLELDIYLPEAKLAIEFNGLYWHSEEKGKDRTYHASKHQKAAAKGVQLVQVWEDDWNRKPELVKQMLAHKLGVSARERVAARKTQVVELSVDAARTFLDENHIQGFGKGFRYLALVEPDQLDVPVAVLVLKREPSTDGKVLNIIRYATSKTVVGGFTKLLKHAERAYEPDSFITFADHMVSDGGLYENNGFVVDKVLRPDYQYVVGGRRVHKFNYRISRFKGDLKLKFEEGLSESELAKLNKIPRVWDAGKTRYVKVVGRTV